MFAESHNRSWLRSSWAWVSASQGTERGTTIRRKSNIAESNAKYSEKQSSSVKVQWSWKYAGEGHITGPNGCSASRRQAIVRHTFKAAKGFSGNGRAHRQEYRSSRKAKLGLAVLDKISLRLRVRLLKVRSPSGALWTQPKVPTTFAQRFRRPVRATLRLCLRPIGPVRCSNCQRSDERGRVSSW